MDNNLYYSYSIFYILKHLSISTQVKNLILVGYRQLWYLLGSAVAFFIVGTLLKSKNNNLKRLNICLVIGMVLYIVGLLGQSYYVLLVPLQNTIIGDAIKAYFKVFNTTRNGLFEGVLFVSVGAMFAF